MAFVRKRLIVVGGVLLIGAGAIWALFLQLLSATRARLLNRSRTISTPYGTLEYALLGRGKPVLVVRRASPAFAFRNLALRVVFRSCRFPSKHTGDEFATVAAPGLVEHAVDVILYR